MSSQKKGKPEKKTSKKAVEKKQEPSQEGNPEIKTEAKVKTQKKIRGDKYLGARSQIDRNKKYPLKSAVELLKKMKYAQFDETVELHLVLKDVVSSIDVSFPHSTGKTFRIQILNDETLKSLEKGIITFDILLATPAQMGKITKYARLLGPKGLMPNPKNGTLTNDPEKKKKELEGGRTTVKGEKKSPLMHVSIGKLSFESKVLEENAEALLKTLGNGKVLKATLSSSMSPGIKISV